MYAFQIIHMQLLNEFWFVKYIDFFDFGKIDDESMD